MSALSRLSDHLDLLRKECPWNASRTFENLRYLTIEEVYELSEAIIAHNQAPDDAALSDNVRKELSDLLLHLLFYAKIAQDNKLFSFDDIADAATEKIIKRHPHLFDPDTKEAVPWEQVKMREGRTSVLEGVPASLPPLVKAVRMHEKARGIGFPEKDEAAAPTLDYTSNEKFGTTLLQALHYAQKQGINPDDALCAALHRYQQKVADWEQQNKK